MWCHLDESCLCPDGVTVEYAEGGREGGKLRIRLWCEEDAQVWCGHLQGTGHRVQGTGYRAGRVWAPAASQGEGDGLEVRGEGDR